MVGPLVPARDLAVFRGEDSVGVFCVVALALSKQFESVAVVSVVGARFKVPFTGAVLRLVRMATPAISATRPLPID